MCQNLLHPQRPLLIPGPRQPSASFHAGNCTARARAFFDSVTASISSTMRVHIVLRLLLGQSKGVDLNAITEASAFRIGRRL